MGVATQACARAASPSPLGFSSRSAHPGRSMGDHDKQVSWLAALKVPASPSRISDPVVFDAGRTAHSCGGSPGFKPEFPLIPVRGTCCVSLRCSNAGRRSIANFPSIHLPLAPSRRQLVQYPRFRCPADLAGLNGKSVRCPSLGRQCRRCPRNGERVKDPAIYHCARAREGAVSGKSTSIREPVDRPET